jgi:hypothetical protein
MASAALGLGRLLVLLVVVDLGEFCVNERRRPVDRKDADYRSAATGRRFEPHRSAVQLDEGTPAAAPVSAPWLWTYGFDPRERQPAHGYAATREAAMAAFKESWLRE